MTVAAIVAFVIFAVMAAIQLALAAGAPFGRHVLGGRYPDVLPGQVRVGSAVAAILLLGFGVVVLGRAGLVGLPESLAGLAAPMCWLIAAYLVLNTLGNLASKSRIERTLFAAITALLALLTGLVAAAG
jgi:hypothetical protein